MLKIFKNFSFLCLKRKYLFCFLFLSLLPFLASLFWSFFQFQKAQAFHSRIVKLSKKQRISFQQRKKYRDFLAHYGKSDPLFVEKYLESLSFLQKEQEQIERRLRLPFFSQDKELVERKNFLSSSKNKLSFSEEKLFKNSEWKESWEKQIYPVELDEEDLSKILSLVEGLSIKGFFPLKKSPQLFFREFTLTKEMPHSFFLETKILKREGLHE